MTKYQMKIMVMAYNNWNFIGPESLYSFSIVNPDVLIESIYY